MSRAIGSPLVRLALAVCALLLLAGQVGAEVRVRVDPELPVSAAMRERVHFWVQVFTEVSQHEVALHDRDDPSVVYDIVPVGCGGAGGPVESARASYQRLLFTMAVEAPRWGLVRPSPERARLAALIGERHGAGPETFARAIANIRAQRGLREVFADGLTRADLYLPAIRKIFREARIPADLVYMPHVESSFNPNAVSRAGAAGLWQFTRATAERYLEVGRADERFHPRRSSEAAAVHLAHARSVLGSWPLAVTAYNHGVAGMARARAALGSESLDDIIRGYQSPSFGFASQNFYAEVLAAAHVARNAARYFPEVRPAPLLQYVVRPGDSLWKIARKHRVTVRSLVAANSLRGTRLQRGQRLVIRQSDEADA